MADTPVQSLSVIIPAFNEAQRIGSTLHRMLDYLTGRGGEFEVIVVDDGSTDDTVKVVEEMMAGSQALRLIGCDRNQGKGAAVRQGALAARFAAVLFSDADLSTPIEAVEDLLTVLAAGADMVIASRAHVQSEIPVDQKTLRKNMGRTFNHVARGVTGLELRDTQCGFKVFRRAVARQVFAATRIDGFAFDVELLVIARAQGWQVAEVPVVWVNSAASRVRIVRHSLQMLRDLIRIRCYDRQGWYLKSD